MFSQPINYEFTAGGPKVGGAAGPELKQTAVDTLEDCVYKTTYHYIFDKLNIPVFDMDILLFKPKDVVQALYASEPKNGIIRCKRLLDYYNELEGAEDRPLGFLTEAIQLIEGLKEHFEKKVKINVISDEQLVNTIDKKILDENEWWSKRNYVDLPLLELEIRFLFLLLQHVPYTPYLYKVVIYEKLDLHDKCGSTKTYNLLNKNFLSFQLGFSIGTDNRFTLNADEMELLDIIQDKKPDIESIYLFTDYNGKRFFKDDFEKFVCRAFGLESIDDVIRYQRLKGFGVVVNDVEEREAQIGVAPMESIEYRRSHMIQGTQLEF